MADIDREVLAAIGPSPSVVILPTAAAGEDPEDWALRGVQHFWQKVVLGLSKDPKKDMAHDPDNVEAIRRADLLYLSGGKTARLLEALEGSPLWEGFLLARQEGAWLVGSSAGAMALGDWALVHRPDDGDGTPTLWMPGLGMLQGLAVVPHFDAWPEAEELTAEILGGCSVIGIDEDTAVLLEGNRGRVAGRGSARRIERQARTIHTAGDSFELPGLG